MEVIRIEPGISLIGLKPPTRGFDKFLGTYVIQSSKTALIDVGPTSTLGDFFAGLAELKVKFEEVALHFLGFFRLALGIALPMAPI